MRGLVTKVNLIANAALIGVAIIVGVILIKRHLLPAGTPSTSTNAVELSHGQKIPALDVDWGRTEQTLVIALQKNCGACTISLPFYKVLAQDGMTAESTQIVVVAPHRVGETSEYLIENGITAQEIRQVRLRMIGVSATPTLLLVNREGVVQEKWVGLLPAHQQNEVLSRVQVGESVRSEKTAAVSPFVPEGPQILDSSLIIDPASLERIVTAKRHIIVLDVGNREAFAEEHIPRAINIPLDELYVRALDELPKSVRIVIYNREGVDGYSIATNKLIMLGYPQPTLLKDGLNGWKLAGMSVANKP